MILDIIDGAVFFLQKQERNLCNFLKHEQEMSCGGENRVTPLKCNISKTI
jgi:hypothetical protein